MQKNEREDMFRAQLQEALNEEADKRGDKMNVERIEILVRLLNTYETDRPDYNAVKKDRYMKKYISHNGGSSDKKKPKRPYNKYLTFRISYRCALISALLVIVLTGSNIAVKASTEKSMSSWLSEAKNSIVFSLQDMVRQDEEMTTEKPVTDGRDEVSQDDFDELEVSSSKIDFDDVDWSKTMKLNYVPDGFVVEEVTVTDIRDGDGSLYIRYKNPSEGGYISLCIQRFSEKNNAYGNNIVGVTYSTTIEYDDFVAYIFVGEECNKALLALDGDIYSITTTLDEKILCKMIDNMGYGK